VPRYIALACAQLDLLTEAQATGSGPAKAA
jgi:hypothetical protein